MSDLVEMAQAICLPKNSVESLEAKMLHLPQVECPLAHIFGPGLYMRELTMPKGAIVIGHHQNFDHVNILVKGHITFFSENGEKTEMSAPKTWIGKPGRKVAYVHEDSVFMNVYATNETDIEKLENHLITRSDSWLKETEVIKNQNSEMLSGDSK